MSAKTLDNTRFGNGFGGFARIAKAGVLRSASSAPKPAATAQDISLQLPADAAPVEALYQATVGAGRRIIAVVGVSAGAGTSVCARALAERSQLAGLRTLLIDATGQAMNSVGGAMGESALTRQALRPANDEIFAYRSLQTLQILWKEKGRMFETVVVDGGRARDDGAAIPGALIARSAEATLLVGVAGRDTRDSIAAARAALGEAFVAGVVINGREQSTVGKELAREAMRLRRWFPGWANALADRARAMKRLDVPA